MSASFPRVAPQTRRRPQRPVKLPPLLVAVFQNGELNHVIKAADPRVGLINEIHKQAASMGLDVHAHAIADEAEVVTPVRRRAARKAVRS